MEIQQGLLRSENYINFENMQEIEELKAKIAELEKRIKALEKYIKEDKEAYKGFIIEKDR